MADFKLLDGGLSLARADADLQWEAAWTLIAEACERGLTGLHPLHPRRDLSSSRDLSCASGGE